MASNRHLGRIVALQSLYEFDFRTESKDIDLDMETILSRNIERYNDTIDDTAFVRTLTEGVLAVSSDLDAIIRPIAPEWPIEQIARVDRTILRMALWELKNGKDVPPKVVINEAVELAKAFGSDNSSKFVNGVLGTAYKQITGDDGENTSSDKPASKSGAKSAEKKPAKPAASKKSSEEK